jgi:glutaredoxin
MNVTDLKKINLELVPTKDLEKLYFEIGVELQERDFGKRYQFEELERAWAEVTNASTQAKNILR